MLITKEIEIDMAHRLPNHWSKCRNLHWHRYKIEVGVDDKVKQIEGSADCGMVVDFSDLKLILMEELDSKFDHWAVFYKKDPYKSNLIAMMELEDQDITKLHFVDFIPTAENLCEYWFNLIEPKLIDKGINIKHLKVYETPTSSVIYTK